MEDSEDLEMPMADRRVEDAPGHWLLARLGKRVLRPGGLDLTHAMLDQANLVDKQVVELAPGLGRTAADILKRAPSSYVGVEKDDAASQLSEKIVGSRGRIVNADASQTGLASESADVVIGEAMLTMQSESNKESIVAEAVRLLRPGGRYAIHELGLRPNDLPEKTKTELRINLARTIKVNARPLTVEEWAQLLEKHGLEVEWTQVAPMQLLNVRRNLNDEGFMGTLRILRNVLRDADARKRVLRMRALFSANKETLCGVAVMARRPLNH